MAKELDAETIAQKKQHKLDWQRRRRQQFIKEHGYSMSAHYATGGMREAVLRRDERKCVKCGMTEQEHLAYWNRPITIDHRNKNRRTNTLDNLQTLCLMCHGRKDLIPQLRVQRVPKHKATILQMRADGHTYQGIANHLGFSIGAIYKWIQIWQIKEAA